MKEPVVVDKRPTYDSDPSTPIVVTKPKPFTARPLGDYIAVKRIPKPQGLIVEADVAQDTPLECEVLAVSPWIDDIKVGDKVLVRRFSGTEVKVDDQDVTLILIHDCLLIL